MNPFQLFCGRVLVGSAQSYKTPVHSSLLTDTYPKDKLVKILTWIVQHPEDGKVIDDISDLGIDGVAGDPSLVRERVFIYATKFIARLTGRKED